MRRNMGRLDLEGVRNVRFDGHDLSEQFEVLDVTMPLFPEVEDVSAETPTGAHYYGRRLGPRDVTLSLSLHTFTDDPLEVFREWRRFSPIITQDTPRRLYLDDEMYLNAVLTGETEMRFLGDRAIVEATFRCHDPYFHGQTHTIPVDGSATFRAVTQCETWPTVTVEATAATVEVTEEASGLTVVVPGVSGKTVRIDSEAMKAYADDVFAPVNMERTDFYPLRPGAACKVTVVGGTGILTYEERAL